MTELRIAGFAIDGKTRPWRGPGYARLKRLLDLVAAAGLLLLFGPLMLLIAAGIKLYSPGPILYRQTRIGRHGVAFQMLKFRSMHVGSDAGRNVAVHREHVQRLIRDGSSPEALGCLSLKLSRDPRIHGLGRLLRKLSLDELPQFINVLRGEMSMVGPRPPLPYEYEIYEIWHRHRLDVPPGITGVWQVTARNQVAFDAMVRLDLEYIQQMSLLFDLKLMLLTPWAMLRGKGGG